MKEVFLAKENEVKFEPVLRGQRKSGRKSIIDMDYEEVQIIADVMQWGMITLTTWLLVKYHQEVEDIPLVHIYDIGTCIDKLKPLVVIVIM